ncbi:MAG: AraC family transcriptional regulator [Prevotella sp.]|nr:AraC family transcriptional regulator [Prevotella sp.]
MEHIVYNELENLKKQLKTQQNHIEELKEGMSLMMRRMDGLGRATEATGPRRRKVDNSDTDERLHERLVELIDEKQLYLDQNVSLRHVAEMLNVTQTRLKLFFAHSEDYGNLYRLMSHHRIMQACRLIKAHPNFSIAAISTECGFVSRKTFYRWFEKEMGCTPLEYQRGKNRQKGEE